VHGFIRLSQILAAEADAELHDTTRIRHELEEAEREARDGRARAARGAARAPRCARCGRGRSGEPCCQSVNLGGTRPKRPPQTMGA
jgi:hypothetical protein